MIIEFLDKRFVAGWRFKLRRLWTIRIALFWTALSAVAGVWGALVYELPTWLYMLLGVTMNVSLGIARLMKQPGVDE